jgi:hypothetical protein
MAPPFARRTCCVARAGQRGDVTLDPDRISASAREELADFLHRPARDTQET